MSDGTDDTGGEAPCRAGELTADGTGGRVLVEADLDAAAGAGGAVWNLPHDGDLDANLVRLDPGQRIAEHGNDEVDVMFVVRSGSGEIAVDGIRHVLGPTSLALVPRGSRRAVVAGSEGIVYLTVHRRRGPLTIGHPRPT